MVEGGGSSGGWLSLLAGGSLMMRSSRLSGTLASNALLMTRSLVLTLFWHCWHSITFPDGTWPSLPGLASGWQARVWLRRQVVQVVWPQDVVRGSRRLSLYC